MEKLVEEERSEDPQALEAGAPGEANLLADEAGGPESGPTLTDIVLAFEQGWGDDWELWYPKDPGATLRFYFQRAPDQLIVILYYKGYKRQERLDPGTWLGMARHPLEVSSYFKSLLRGLKEKVDAMSK